MTFLCPFLSLSMIQILWLEGCAAGVGPAAGRAGGRSVCHRAPGLTRGSASAGGGRNLPSREEIVHTKYILLQQNKVIDLVSFVTWFPWKAFSCVLSHNQGELSKSEGFKKVQDNQSEWE